LRASPSPGELDVIAGLILAASQGKRLGAVKPLMPADHAVLLDKVVRQCRKAKLDELIVVLGHEARQIVQRIPLNGIKVIINSEHRVGSSSSIQRGLAHVSSRFDAVMIGSGAMPLVTSDTIDTLIAEYKKSKKGIVVPVHDSQRGQPVIIDMKYLEALLTLRGDIGTKAVLDSHPDDIREVKVDSDEVLIDIDTREAWEKVRSRLS
jgi:molybdenum cofactor cytidylyltransferase